MANTLLDLFEKNPQLLEWSDKVTLLSRQLVMGFSGSSKAVVMASALSEQVPKILIVTSTQNEAEQLTGDLSAILGEDKVYSFFADDVVAAEFIFASPEKTHSRLESLNFLIDKESSGILVTSLVGTKLHLPNPEVYKDSRIDLTLGEEHDLEALSKHLTHIGYQRVEQVLSPGEFSRRGDILDIYELTAELPYRLEFFGDEIDGIRQFDSDSQKSLDNLEHIIVSPADDIILTREDYQRAEKALESAVSKAEGPHKAYLEEVLSVTIDGYRHKDLRKFLSLFYDKAYTLFDYLPKGTPVFIDDFQKIVDRHGRLELEVANLLTEDLHQGKSLSHLNYLVDSFKTLRNYQPASFFSNFHKGLGNLKFDKLYQFTQYPMQEFFNQFPLLVDEIHRYTKNKATVILQVGSEKQLKSLKETLEEYDLDLPLSSFGDLIPHKPQLVLGNLSNGFYFADEKLVLVTEREIFHKKVKRRARASHVSNAERLKDYNELEKGDYVVHQTHGIGQFKGIETIEIKGVHRDYLTIQYQDAATISLPVEQIESLSKYVSADGKEPKINKLNDGRFQKTKQKVSKQVEDIADDLLKLYAERSQLKGFAFSPDDDNQRDFEDDFAYAETEDQLRSIKEIKVDMESDKPMDRLLVGDVGFGKTEVAMRAAFKAANDGKQVAILVPTTVLAHQHYLNFKERFENHAVEVDELSRFRSKKEQNETIENLAKGRIDIIIGTHRLLSKDVKFSDLGLLVIDEEQRFGVKHKEKLKELKAKVDVLTLTATPIPRTLHMSMLGIRDLSIIETAPTNRYPVQTYVMETNPSLIREAILREMDRGGQIFYVYNRVETIDQKVSELHELVPEARIGFVHGQMSEVMLENTLLDFLNGDYDVLVATTIIETGIDISNVNTLFIENADHMGLSTLYQLRGRVGRSNRIAYAYLMYRPDKVLTEVSEKRLDAIKGFTELGSGFKIAMRDLSIRGSGDILGGKQAGFIDDIGFEMYMKILQDAINVRMHKDEKPEEEVKNLNVSVDGYIPDDYVESDYEKLELYQRLDKAKTMSELNSLKAEFDDYYGNLPEAILTLIEKRKLEILSHYSIIEDIKDSGKQLEIIFSPNAFETISGDKLFLLANQLFTKPAFKSLDNKITIKINKHDQWLNRLNEFIETLSKK